MRIRDRTLANLGGSGQQPRRAIKRVKDAPVVAIDDAIKTTLQNTVDGYRLPDVYRKSDYTHVSDLINKCFRVVALTHFYDCTPQPGVLFPVLDLACFLGEKVHDVLRDRLSRRHPDNVYGAWVCRCKKPTPVFGTYSQALKKGVCAKCGHLHDQYEEIELKDDDARIKGHVDLLWYDIEQECFIVIELKSISENEFEKLKRPVADASLQSVFYWSLLRKNGYKVADKTVVIYTKKRRKVKDSAYKTFAVNPYEFLPQVERLVDLKKRVVVAKNYSQLPKLRVKSCQKFECSSARTCGLSSLCYSLDPDRES